MVLMRGFSSRFTLCTWVLANMMNQSSFQSPIMRFYRAFWEGLDFFFVFLGKWKVLILLVFIDGIVFQLFWLLHSHLLQSMVEFGRKKMLVSW